MFGWKVETIREFETRHAGHDPETGALLQHACMAVESLYYLDELDQAFDVSRTAAVGEYDPALVDVSHSRWATGTSVTALDLCAAALGRAFCRRRETDGELDLLGLKGRRDSLPALAQGWLDSVLRD